MVLESMSVESEVEAEPKQNALTTKVLAAKNLFDIKMT